MYDLQIVVKEFIKLNGGEVEGEEEQPQQENNNIDVNQQEQEVQKVEEKQEKKNVKKISMFDVMPSNKSKSEPINPKVQQTKPQPKPQPKLQKSVAIKEKDISDVNNIIDKLREKEKAMIGFYKSSEQNRVNKMKDDITILFNDLKIYMG